MIATSRSTVESYARAIRDVDVERPGVRVHAG